jgi:GTP-binding protein
LGEVTTEASDVGVLLFSAPKHVGLGDLAETLHGWARIDRGAAVDRSAENPA